MNRRPLRRRPPTAGQVGRCQRTLGPQRNQGIDDMVVTDRAAVPVTSPMERSRPLHPAAAVSNDEASDEASDEVNVEANDEEIALHLERIIHRVKQSMNYRGSYSTRDILGSLVARWVRSGEWDRLKQVPPDQRHLGQSVRRFILDRLDQLRRRGEREDID